MALKHPIDAEIRGRLKQLGPNQKELAQGIGRSISWLNKYIHGAGNAAIDDLIRIAALMIGVEAQALSETERRLVRAWKQIPEDDQIAAVEFFENHARFLRRAHEREQGGPKGRTPRETKNTTRGKRRAVEPKAENGV